MRFSAAVIAANVESSIKVRFSAVVTAASVKPCIVIVLDILFKHLRSSDFVMILSGV